LRRRHPQRRDRREPQRRETSDGIERIFQVNVLAPYVLTGTSPAVPLALTAAATIRIGSGAVQIGPARHCPQWRNSG
jgi:hypothetical protein